MYFSRRSFLSLLPGLSVAGLSLASCGDTGTTSSTTNSSSSMTLKVGQVTNSISFFPLYVAVQKGFFKAQGLTLDPATPPSLNSGAKLATAVEAGGIDIGVGGITDVFTISRVDSSIKIVGGTANAFILDVVASKNFEQQNHLTATSPLADKIKALEGKKVGISAPNSATDALITYLFRQQGMDAQKDVVKVNLGADTFTDLAALKAGRVDAVAVTAPGGEIAEEQGIGNAFISPVRGDVPTMVGQLFGVAYTKQNLIDTKPKAVQAFIRGIAQAEDFIQKNPDQMYPLLEKYLHIDQKVTGLLWTATKSCMPLTPQVSQQAYDTANNFHVKAGLIAVALDYKDLVATDTINKALSGMTGS
jgi:NitT/TauT family transport system substrate-binding protein